jgi:hypothetical protein
MTQESPYIRGRQLGALHFPFHLTTEAACKGAVTKAVRKVLGGYTMGHLGLWRSLQNTSGDQYQVFRYEIAVHCSKHRKFVIEMWIKTNYNDPAGLKYELLQAVIYEWKDNRKQ